MYPHSKTNVCHHGVANFTIWLFVFYHWELRHLQECIHVDKSFYIVDTFVISFSFSVVCRVFNFKHIGSVVP
jgi:hypothetical protein